MTPMRIAVTGADIICSAGDGVAAFASTLFAGRRAPPRIADFDVDRYPPVRGMRLYNRTTQLAVCAARRAVGGDGGAEPELGLIMAATTGHLDTLFAYDRSLLQNGVARTNPAWMPLSLASAPGAATALAIGAQAFSITVSDGAASSLDALGLAARFLAAGRARRCVVVSAFSPSAELVEAAVAAGELAAVEEALPFDAASRGMAFGELAVALVLERRDEGDGEALGFVRAQAARFAQRSAADALADACAAALRRAGGRRGVALVSSGANGVAGVDEPSARALLALGGGVDEARVCAVKSLFGEVEDAGGLLQVLAALLALREGRAPAIASSLTPAVAGLRYATEPARVDGELALATAVSRAGGCSAVVLARGAAS